MPVFLAQIHIPDLGTTMHGEIIGVHLAQGDSPHRVLLGRDFLRDHLMFYDGNTPQVTLLK